MARKKRRRWAEDLIAPETIDKILTITNVARRNWDEAFEKVDVAIMFD